MAPACGVTSLLNNASITNGTAGKAVNVGVAETAGVAVSAKAVAACVGVLRGAKVSVGGMGVGIGVLL